MRLIPYCLLALCLCSLTTKPALAQSQGPVVERRVQEAARRFAEQVGAYVPYAQAYNAALRGYAQAGQPTPASTIAPVTSRREMVPQRSVLIRSARAGQNTAISTLPGEPHLEALPTFTRRSRDVAATMEPRPIPNDPRPERSSRCACSQGE